MIYFKLKTLLNERGLTQIELARKTGVRPPTISAICNNTIKELPVNVLEKICDFMSCEPGDLIELIPAGELEKRREIIGSGYDLPLTTREERKKTLDHALAISALGGSEPSRAAVKLLDQFVEGHITEEEMLKVTLERYLVQEE